MVESHVYRYEPHIRMRDNEAIADWYIPSPWP